MEKRISKHALAAKNIRQELKAAFPNTKFSVTSESYSMGDSINVNYVNGQSYHDVNAIVSKYQRGEVDSNYDSYENFENFDDSKGSTKYAFVNRKYTVDAVKQVAAELKIDVTFDEYDRWDVVECRQYDMIASRLSATTF